MLRFRWPFLAALAVALAGLGRGAVAAPALAASDVHVAQANNGVWFTLK